MSTNRDILEVWGAVVELNAKSLPTLVSLRIGRNLNSLRSVIDVLEDQRKKLVEEHKIGQEFEKDADYPAKMKGFEKAWDLVMHDDSGWTPPITIPANLAENAKEFAYAAQLFAAGILTE